MLCWWMEVDQLWGCIDPSIDFGQLVLNGCEVNCASCPADEQAFFYQIGVNVAAPPRWVRPSTAKESRAADGVHRPLVAGVPVRVPYNPLGGTYYEIAPCYATGDDQGYGLEGSREYWKLGICDCSPWPWFWENEKQICPEFSPGGFQPYYRPGNVPHCWHFTGNSWPPAPFSHINGMYCTGKSYGHGPMEIMLSGAGLNEICSLRLGGGCAVNMGALCWGHVEDSKCESEHEWESEYYNEEPDYSIFNYALVDATAATFVTPTNSSDEWAAVQEAKSAALNYLATHTLPADGGGVTSFYQLDSMRRYASPEDNHNGTLTLWQRSWNLFGGAANIAWRNLPVICEFPNSYLKCSGHSVVVEYVLTGVLWEMSLVLFRRKNMPLGGSPYTYPEQYATYPFIKHRIECNMGLRVRFPDSDPRTINRSWLETPDDVALTLNDGYRIWPYVTPAHLDRIIYVDSSGRTFNPPQQAVWEGSLGFFSDPAATDTDVYDYDYSVSALTQPHCIALARGLDGSDGLGLPCPAVQSHPEHDEGDRSRIWGGDVKMRFPHGT